MARNPKWSRDELILALELYFRENPIHTSASNPEIIKLSSTLNQLPIHPEAKHGEKFRNANGVYMKLCNYLRFDPGYTGEGLKGGGKLEEEIWDDFAEDRLRLTEVATSILAGMTEVSAPADLTEAAIDEEEEFPEGRVLTQLHKRRERNRKATKKKKGQRSPSATSAESTLNHGNNPHKDELPRIGSREDRSRHHGKKR